MRYPISFILDNLVPIFVLDIKESRAKATDAIKAILKLNNTEALRVYNSMRGEIPQLGFPHDFSKKSDDLVKHNFILPKDINKYIVWTDNDFAYQQECSARWLISNFNKRLNDNFISESINIIKQLNICMSSGIPILDIIALDKHIPNFIIWLDKFMQNNVVSNHRSLVLTYASSLIYEYDMFQDIWLSYYKKRIKQSIDAYCSMIRCEQVLSRDVRSTEITLWINVCMYFDLLKNPSDVLDREWNSWPILYKKGTQSTIRYPLAYELCYRMSRNRSVDFDSILLEKDPAERAKMPHLLGCLNSYRKHNINVKSFWATDIIKILVNLLVDNTKLTYYESVRIVSGRHSIYKDSRDDYIPVPAEQIEFFIALKNLGLQPYRPSKSECIKIYGYVERMPGFMLGVLTYPHAIQFVSSNKCIKKSRKNKFFNKISRWHARSYRVLTIWMDSHLGNLTPTPMRLKRTILLLAKNGVPMAKDIAPYIKG